MILFFVKASTCIKRIAIKNKQITKTTQIKNNNERFNEIQFNYSAKNKSK